MKKSLLLTGAVVSLLLQGCAGYHVFNTTSTPNLTHKSEKKLDIYPGLDHVEGQFAWSPKKHRGFLANTYVSYPTPSMNSVGTLHGEAAYGFYRGFNEQSAKKGKWYFDGYGGFGLGQRYYKGVTYYNPIGNENIIRIYSAYEKTFAQSSIYYKRPRLCFSLTVQGAWIYFNTFNSHYIHIKGGGHYSGTILSFRNQSMLDLNTAITAKFRFKKRSWHFITQVAGNYSYIDSKYGGWYHSFNRRPVALNCGIHIPLISKKDKQEIDEAH